jgi:3-hydroxyisobutyrate dehydrogenase-like beta-hydroxyacid dehydrogenase
MSAASMERIGIIGFGEVGGIFGQDLAAGGTSVMVYDTLFQGNGTRSLALEKATRAGVVVAGSLEEMLQSADVVLSAVTASSALPAAKEAAPYLRRGQVYVDMNSVSPDTKKSIGGEIEKSGADFVEAAVMAAVKPARMRTPILLGGARASEMAGELQRLGLDATAASDRIGVASAIKMCRSVVMKGLAALAIESLFAARRYGAEDAVLTSFAQTYPGMGWDKGLADALTRRAVEHSRRREGEMREVVETLRSAGMNYGMAESTADLQKWLTGEMEARGLNFKGESALTWQTVADALAAPLTNDRKEKQ